MEGLQFVELDEIMYCESQDNYTRFFLIDGRKIMVSKTIKHFEEMLDPYKFYRVHRSNIINLKYIDKYVKGEGSYVVLKQGPRVPVSRRRKEGFLQLFNYQITHKLPVNNHFVPFSKRVVSDRILFTNFTPRKIEKLR